MLPVTFSAPGDSYEPTVADCLRDGVYLMLYADNLNRKTYSYDDDDPSKGVRINSEVEQTDEDARLVVPQQIVAVAFGGTRFTLHTSSGGSLRITISIGFIEANDSASLDVDILSPPATVLAKMGRVEEILRKGTLHVAGMTTNNGRVVDPYNSPLNEDGTYDVSQIRELNRNLPEIQYAAPRAIRRIPPTEEETWLDPVRDIGVLYALTATYEIDMSDRENMRIGGFQND